MDLAAWAPNGDNRQLWAFYVVKNRRVIEKIADAVKAKSELMAAWPESQRFGASRFQSAAAGIATLLLALHQQGLGSCWMARPQHAKRESEQLLEVPLELDFVTLLPVGYPAESPAPGPRRDIEKAVRFISQHPASPVDSSHHR